MTMDGAMRLMTRQIPSVLPGVRGVLRVGRPTKTLLRRLREGDIAVIDHIDLDRATALALRDAGVAAVVNAKPLVSGRYPNRGPDVLAEAGIVLVDGIGEEGFEALTDGRRARIHEGGVFDGEKPLAEGRAVDKKTVEEDKERARKGLSAHLELFTHNSSELLRREEGVLLHGNGVPPLDAAIAGRPVLVVADHPDLPGQLRALRRFVRERRPVVVAVGAAAAAVGRRMLRDGVVVVGEDPDAFPQQRVLTAARDVVLACGSSSSGPAMQALERVGVEPRRFDSSLAPEDAALLIAYAHHPSVVVGAGLSTTLTDFLEAQRPGLAGTFLTRLALGPALVDAGTVPVLRRRGSGAGRRWVLAAGLGVVGLAAGVVLGAGPLQGRAAELGIGVPEQQAGGGATTHQSAAQREDAGAARFVTDNRAQLLSGALTGKRVAILALPGADPATVKGIAADVQAAGGRTTGVLQAQPDLLAPTRRQYVDTLSAQLADQLSSGSTKVDARADTYRRIGQVIGATYAGTTDASTFGHGAETAAVALLKGRLVRAEGRPTGPAQSVVVVLGDDRRAAQEKPALTGLVQGLGTTSQGVVVAGGTDSVALQQVREQRWPGWLASVDGVDTATGQVATTLAVTRAMTDQGGRFGASGFNGLLVR